MTTVAATVVVMGSKVGTTTAMHMVTWKTIMKETENDTKKDYINDDGNLVW